MRLVPALFPALLCAATMAQGISLAEIPELARKRLDAQRQRVLASLEPYMEDLLLDGSNPENLRYLEPKFADIAAFGDSVLPILFDLLSPDEDSGEKRALASNCARILAGMQPVRFLAELTVLVAGKDPQARLHAIDLLGQTGDPRAAKTIAKVFDKLRGEPLSRALRALGRLGSAEAAAAAMRHLASNDPRLRRKVLDYLRRSQAVSVVDEVRGYFIGETVTGLRPAYLRYFTTVVHDDAGIAAVLAPLLAGTELDYQERRGLAMALGRMAPRGHQTSIDALMAVLDGGAYDGLGIAAALSLRELGENRGARKLFLLLDRRLRQSRLAATRYSDRAEAHFAFGNWKKAKKDYELALRHSQASPGRSVYQLRLARCEARLGKARPFLSALKSSGIGWNSIMAEARNDAAFARALEDPAAQRYLSSLKPKKPER